MQKHKRETCESLKRKHVEAQKGNSHPLFSPFHPVSALYKLLHIRLMHISTPFNSISFHSPPWNTLLPHIHSTSQNTLLPHISQNTPLHSTTLYPTYFIEIDNKSDLRSVMDSPS